jgi:hypothetical protein
MTMNFLGHLGAGHKHALKVIFGFRTGLYLYCANRGKDCARALIGCTSKVVIRNTHKNFL